MNPSPTPPIPLIIGPTASGKSGLAVEVALRLRNEQGTPAEVVTADAFQIYTAMDIGTAKPTPAEQRGVPHHLIDLVDPFALRTFTVSDWLSHAHAAIDDIRCRGSTPIVCGGTSLYVQSLLRGLFDGPPADESLRAQHQALPPAQLRTELEAVDPAAAERIHPNDLRRTVRAIEVFRLTGKPISAWQTQWETDAAPSSGDAAALRFRVFVLTWSPEDLNRRINARVRHMMDAGLLDEVRTLAARGQLNAQAREALGYKQLLAHLADPRGLPLSDAVEKIKIETRRFAKNQRTWMKRLACGGTGIPGDLPTDRAAEIVLSEIGETPTPIR